MVESYKQDPFQRINGKLTLPAIDEEMKRQQGKENACHVFASFTMSSDIQKPIEQAGSSYEKLKVRVHKQQQREINRSAKKTTEGQEEQDSGSESEEEKKEESSHHEEWEKKRKKRTREEIEREALLMGDLYAILGLEHLTYEAGEGDIKSAYKKLALMYHPDKMGDKITQSDKEVWLSVQNAYENLIDPVKRKRYDSSLPFDDNIPSEQTDNITDENFYEIFEPVFRRNARFATKKPVPNIGDPSMHLDQVHKFYKYWDNFQTWRDFSQYDEYDVREAQDRYERRYMEKENKKMRDKHMKKERTRLIKLVELAYKLDPRIKQQRLKEEQEKLRIKQERKDRIQREKKEIEDKIQAEQEAKQREIQKQQEEERRIKEEKDQALKKRKETIRLLGQLCQENLPDTKYDRFFVEEFCKKIKTTEDIESLISTLKSASDFKEQLEECIAQYSQQHEQQKIQSQKDSAGKKEESKKSDWTLDELSKLSKAIVKYPGAIPNRWKVITEYIATDKTQKQVIAKAQELAQKQSLKQAGKTIKSSTYSEKQLKEKKKQEQPIQKPDEVKVEAEAQPPADTWSNEQQKQLEVGMREFPGSMPVKERWIKIAEKVDGKTAKECYERFKEICALLKKKQEGKE